MNQILHTPGPWRAKKDPETPERGEVYICGWGKYEKNETLGEAYRTDYDADRGNLHNTEANARLMAAAPDLFEALQLIQVFNWRLDDSEHGKEIKRRALAALSKAQ